jgi:5-methylcytosine-specific restriction enzyme subunit McrC
MFVYNMYWKADRSMLLYPRNNNQQDVEGKYAKFGDSTGQSSCQLAFVDVLKGGKLNLEIGREILVMMGCKG